MTGSRYLPVALTLLFVITGSAVPHAQQVPQTNASAPSTTSTVPRSVPFNGQVLTPKGEIRTGSVVLTFGLYADQKEGTPLWTEQQLVALDQDGQYSVILGSGSRNGLPAEAFNVGAPRWLGVQVDGEKEQPRFMLLSVPYALKASDADTLGGKPASEFVLAAQLFDRKSSPLTDAITVTMKEAGYPPKPWAPLSTVNRLAKFVGTNNEIGDSIVFENGGAIGINTVPLYPFHVVASSNYQALRLDTNHIVGSSFTLGPTGFAGEHVYSLLATGPGASTGAGYLTVYDEVAGQYRLVINPNGEAGIGTAAPISRLHVSGASATSTTFTLENLSGQASRQMFLSTYGSAGAGAYWSGLDSANTSSLWGPNLFVLRASNGLVFSGSSAAEHMRIAPAGNVGVGTASPAARLHVEQSFGDAVKAHTLNGSAVFARSENGRAGNFEGEVRIAGNTFAEGVVSIGTLTPVARLHVEETSVPTIYAHNVNDYALLARSENNYAGVFEGYTWFKNLIKVSTLGSAGSNHLCLNAGTGGAPPEIASCSSSLRYKTDVEAFPRGLDLVSRLRPIRFTWKNSGAPGIGLAAEQVNEVEPLLAFRNEHGEIEGVRYDQLTAVFVNAINQQQEEISQLHDRLAEQRNIVAAQQRQVEALTLLVCALAPEPAQACDPLVKQP